MAKKKTMKDGSAAPAGSSVRFSDDQMLHLLTRTMRDVVWILDADTLAYLYVSPSVENLCGYTPAEFMALPLDQAFLSPATETVTATIRKRREALRDGSRPSDAYFTDEVRLPRKDGTTIWAEIVSRFYDDARTGRLELHGVTRDITDRKSVEATLLDERNLLHALLDSTTDRVYFKDQSLRFTKVSRAYASFHGLSSAEDAVGKTFPDFASGDWVREVVADDRRILETGTPLIAKIEQVRHPGGRTLWTSTSKVPTKDAHGKVTGIIGISRDITTEVELRRQIEQTAKMEAIGHLAGGIAHDFNNLLQAILGFTELILSNSAPDDPRRADLLAIDHAAKRAAELTRQLLAFSQKQTMIPKTLNLNTIAGTAQRILHRLLGETIHLTTELAPDLYPIKCDPGQVDQIIINLAVNSRDAMPEGGHLTLATRNVDFHSGNLPSIPQARIGQFACLSITDTGTGMTREVQSHLFEPFFTTKEVGKGTGLGLAVVYGIVNQHHGWIDVTSEPGKGTTFNIYFPRQVAVPRTESAVNTPTPVPPPSTCPVSQRILLVEDDPGVRHLTHSALIKAGYAVVSCGTGGEALEAADKAQVPFDGLFVDAVLPDMKGVDVIAHCRARHPALQVILCSGYAQDQAMPASADSQAAFLQKPFAISALLDTFHTLLTPPAPPGAT